MKEVTRRRKAKKHRSATKRAQESRRIAREARPIHHLVPNPRGPGLIHTGTTYPGGIAAHDRRFALYKEQRPAAKRNGWTIGIGVGLVLGALFAFLSKEAHVPIAGVIAIGVGLGLVLIFVVADFAESSLTEGLKIRLFGPRERWPHEVNALR